MGWGGRDGESPPGGARVAAAGRAPRLENVQSKPLTNQGMKPGGEGAEERFGLRSPPPNIPGPITPGRGRVWRIPGENAATATRRRLGSLPPALEDSLPPISEDFGFSQSRSPSPGRAAGPSLRATQPGSTASPSHRSRRPPAHAAGAQEASSAASSIPGWGRLLTSTTRSLHFMHHRASCQRSPGARLFIAAMMHESEIARRGSAGGGRQPQSSRRNWRLIYKQQICYVRLIDGKWRESPEMGSSESRFLAAALL